MIEQGIRGRARSLALALLAVMAVLAVAARAQSSPPIAGLAHVALGVRDVEASRAFYARLGFEEAFHFGEEHALTQSFLKVNDTQFLELYPVKVGEQPGFLHLCFLGEDLEALNRFYVARGLAPKPVRKARAGNLLFTMEGPEGQNIEYTQLMPGSLHSEDRGKHLGGRRVADRLLAVSVTLRDREAGRTFYREKLGFAETEGHPYVMQIPGGSAQQVSLAGAGLLPHARMFFRVPDLALVAADLRRRAVAFQRRATGLEVTDPDGNSLVFTTAATVTEP